MQIESLAQRRIIPDPEQDSQLVRDVHAYIRQERTRLNVAAQVTEILRSKQGFYTETQDVLSNVINLSPRLRYAQTWLVSSANEILTQWSTKFQNYLENYGSTIGSIAPVYPIPPFTFGYLPPQYSQDKQS